jgi:hypothetical protein
VFSKDDYEMMKLLEKKQKLASDGGKKVTAAKAGSGVSVEDELLLIHQWMGHSSFNLLERLYPSKYEKADKQKLVCDACEFGKHTRSSYVSSGSRSSHAFDLVHSDVWGPSSTTAMNEYRFFVTFIDCYTRVT